MTDTFTFKDYLDDQTIAEHNANVPLWREQTTAQYLALQNIFNEELEGA